RAVWRSRRRPMGRGDCDSGTCRQVQSDEVGRMDSRPDLQVGRRAAKAGKVEGAMNIGIVCYASIGGSGIIATELGKRLVSRGHCVHVLSSDMPARLGDYQPGLSFHRV